MRSPLIGGVMGVAGAAACISVLGCASSRQVDAAHGARAGAGSDAPLKTEAVPSDAMVTLYNVQVPMRDGMHLSANIYKPAGDGRFPVILSRTPYVKGGTGGGVERRRKFVKQGYVWVDVDVRGRGDSEGVFRPFFQERKDGYDTVEWCGRQAWSTGKVGMVGGSYGGYVQLAAAVERPPSLACLAPSVACPDPFVDGLFMGPTGLPGPICVSWYQYTAGHVNQSSNSTPWAEVFKHRPLITLDDAAGMDLAFWNEMIEHAQLSPWWEESRYQNKLDLLGVPCLHISGWYDDEQISTMTNYTLASTKPPAEVRRNQKLLMGAWPHGVNSSTRIGAIEFGASAVIDMDALLTRWFDRWLKGKKNGIEDEKPVRIFVMGANEWRSEDAWPIPRTKFTPYYLGSGGAANTSGGNGVLCARGGGEGGAGEDHFVYDPGDPVPFITDPGFSQVGGPDDYREIEKRQDVLVYSTGPLTEAVEVCGPVEARLWAATDAPDTDFTARLCIVRADGTSQRLCDGIVRARFRNGLERPELLESKGPHEYRIEMWNTCQTFKQGEQIRVEISSSSFPQWDANPNTGERLGFETTMQTAKQTILHDAEHPSRVILPVVPAAAK